MSDVELPDWVRAAERERRKRIAPRVALLSAGCGSAGAGAGGTAGFVVAVTGMALVVGLPRFLRGRRRRAALATGTPSTLVRVHEAPAGQVDWEQLAGQSSPAPGTPVLDGPVLEELVLNEHEWVCRAAGETPDSLSRRVVIPRQVAEDFDYWRVSGAASRSERGYLEIRFEDGGLLRCEVWDFTRTFHQWDRRWPTPVGSDVKKVDSLVRRP